MQVGILGPLEVRVDGQPVEISGARLRALLIRLAAGAGGWLTVGELVEALWESEPPGDEVNALQSLVSRLRRALPRPDLIESGPAGYRLAIDPEAVDAIGFERLARAGRRALTAGQAQEAFRALTEALALWRGPALVEVVAAGYAIGWIERLDKRRLTAIEQHAEAGLQLGLHADLIADLEEVTARHPLRERSHELLIRALAGVERQREALEVYDRLSGNLVEQLGLDPPMHLQHLQLAVLRNDPQLQAAAAQPPPEPAVSSGPARARRTNLRTPLTSFIGRDLELTRLAELVTRSRLLTLTGTGGAGKSRLACELVARVPTVGTDGVWFIELAPVTDPEDVASTVLAGIGSVERHLLERATTHRDTLSRLFEALGEQDVLLILDNCEHLLDAAAGLAAQVLGRCPNLTVLATSREPLGIVGESLWPLQPLASPAPQMPPEQSRSTPAVELFVDRAVRVRPGFVLTETNSAAVTEICRRLDGLPLAIELAAARLRNLPVETIAQRLGNRFRLLTGGNRTALPRHRTLQAVVAWSWDLLSEPERVLLERLSVIPAGASAESATAICTGDQSRSDEAVADLLSSLSVRSLLVMVEPDEDDGGGPRYRMLETIREYAAERLTERGEADRMKAAHAAYFLALAETADAQLRGHDQLIWLRRLTLERDNLLATLRYAAEAGDADTAVRLVSVLAWLWMLLGRHDQADSWLEQTLEIPGEASAQPRLIVEVLAAINRSITGQGSAGQEFTDRLERQVAAFPLAERHPMLALVEPGLALVAEQPGLAEAAVEINLAHPDPWARAMLHLMSGVAAENNGDIELMEHRLPEALAGFRETGDRWGTATAIGALANLHAARGDLDRTIEQLQQARALMIEMNIADDATFTLIRIGMIRMRAGDLVGARRDIETGIAQAEIGAQTYSARVYGDFALGMLARHEGDHARARALSEHGLALIHDRYTPSQVQSVLLLLLALLDLDEGSAAAAAGRLTEALEHLGRFPDLPIAAMVATGVAELALVEGDPDAAAQVLGAGVRLRGMDDVTDPEVRRVGAAVRAMLAPKRFTEQHSKGHGLDRRAAMELLRTVAAARS